MLVAAPGFLPPKTPVPDWLKALQQRSQGMNSLYGIGSQSRPGITDASGGYNDGAAAPSSVPAPATLAAPKTINAPGYDPDYAALIAADPSLLAGESDIANMRSQLGDARQAAIRRAVIQTGFSPGGTVGELDQATLDAAGQNPYSTKALLDQSRTHAGTDLHARLAARGILDSGALTGGDQQIQTGYEQQSQQAIQALLAAISGYQGDYASKDFQLMLQKAGLRDSAAQRVAADPRYRPVAPGHASLDPASGLYVTADGRWYTADGQPASPPGEAPPPDVSAPDSPALQAESIAPIFGLRTARNPYEGI